MPDAVHVALLKALVVCLMFLDESPEDIADLHAVVRTLECVGDELNQLSDADRAALAALMRMVAAEQPEGPGRRWLVGLASGYEQPGPIPPD